MPRSNISAQSIASFFRLHTSGTWQSLITMARPLYERRQIDSYNDDKNNSNNNDSNCDTNNINYSINNYDPLGSKFETEEQMFLVVSGTSGHLTDSMF